MTEIANGPKKKKPFAVMLSSTYSELIDHRRAVREAMLTQRLLPVAMEDDAALPGQDPISASLGKVDEADAYVGLVSYRYGQTPEDKDRNPDAVSLTELEFRRAVLRKIPICMFLMHDDYPVPQRVIDEEKPETREKRASFVALVKKDRIFAEFKSVEDLKTKAVQSLVELRRVLEAPDAQPIEVSIALPSRPIASAEELRLTFDNTHQSRRPCQGASVGDLNMELVREFASKVAPELIADKATTEDTLPFRLGLLSAIPELGKLIPHNSAILCFSDSPQKYLPQARASFSVEGEDADDFVLKRVEGPLYRQITALIQLVLNELRTKVSFDQSGRRVETPEIPNDVIREAISNAVSHRDYHQAATGNVQVRVRKDTIEITNPGSFPVDFLWDTLLDSDGVSSPNDAFVAYFLTIQLAFEGIGRGFRIFREYIKQNGRDAISFEKCPGPAIRVRIRRPQKIDAVIKPTAAASNVPINVPAQFFGREEEIAALEKALTGQTGRVAITALHGLRGVGKSTLVAAFAERHRADYRAVWWIRAETESTMRADLVGLGARLGWIAADQKEEPALAAVMQQLHEAGERILLIYDNANNVDELREYMPRGGAAQVIVTSNSPGWGGIAASMEIEVWPTEVGADYLIERTGRDRERDAALVLSEALGGLPLALEQASAYCERLGIPFVDYLRRFEATPAKLLDAKRDAPREYRDRMTVAKTFALAIDEAAKLHPAAEPLLFHASLLAPEPVPLFLFSEALEEFGKPLASELAGEGLDEAIAALRAFALIDRETVADERDSSIVTDCVRVHGLVRIIAAARSSEQTSAALKREAALGHVVAAFVRVYPRDIRRDPRIWRLFPHVSWVLENIVKDYGESEARSFLDRLSRLVVMALRFAEDGQRAGNLGPDNIARILGDFYEVEPLKIAISLLLKDHREVWSRLQKQFLNTNNYVLRYAMAHALADGIRETPPWVSKDEIVQLIGKERTINEFEVGGYALNLIYARDPQQIDRSVLMTLVERPEYPGRSILGDLLLNLVFRTNAKLGSMRSLISNLRFWNSIWDFIKVDVHAIEAAEAFMEKPRHAISQHAWDAMDDFEKLASSEAVRSALLQSLGYGHIRKMLEGYFSLGQDTKPISQAADELAKLAQSDLSEMIKLLFAHPIWVVAEAAATTLTSLVEADPQRIEIVCKLLEDKNWRVQYGACETAFIMKDQHPQLFLRSVHRFYDNPNCKIRGLCAENLFSHILNSSSRVRTELLAEFEEEIHCWLRDEDCWVLEHIFRFFHTLHKRQFDVETLFPTRLSPLLDGASRWFTFDRGDFLLHIERQKAAIEFRTT